MNLNIMKVSRRNIGLCRPDLTQDEREALCKQSVQETCALALETCVVWRRDQHWLNKTIENIYGEELLHEAIEKKQGLIVLGPHIGNWEVLGRCLPAYGHIVSLYAPPKKKDMEKFVKEAREHSGATLVPTNSRGIARILKHLKSGGITGILPDQVPPPTGGAHAPFYGISALTMTLVHGLYQRTSCAILMGAALRTNAGFNLHFMKPDEAIFSTELEDSLTGLNRSVENIITLAPEQYQWEYKRFKKQADKTSYYSDLV